jgi:hypothetical protein
VSGSLRNIVIPPLLRANDWAVLKHALYGLG